MQNIKENLKFKNWEGEWNDIANYNKQFMCRLLVPKPIYLVKIIGCITKNRIQIIINIF